MGICLSHFLAVDARTTCQFSFPSRDILFKNSMNSTLLFWRGEISELTISTDLYFFLSYSFDVNVNSGWMSLMAYSHWSTPGLDRYRNQVLSTVPCWLEWTHWFETETGRGIGPIVFYHTSPIPFTGQIVQILWDYNVVSFIICFNCGYSQLLQQ